MDYLTFISIFLTYFLLIVLTSLLFRLKKLHNGRKSNPRYSNRNIKRKINI
jgi:hypothetical protein